MRAATGHVTACMIANAIEKTRLTDPVKIADHIRSSRFEHPIFAWPLSYTEWGVSYTEWGELKEATLYMVTLVKKSPPSGVNPGANWWTEVVYKSSPLTPYQPEK
jgi:hypothetical protein